MKKLFILLLSVLSLTAFAQQKKVAVYVTGEQSGVSKVLGDQLVAAFAKSGKYTAIERTTSFLSEIGKEHGYQRTGAVNDSEIARLGVQFGVNYVCVADMSDVFGEKYITARLIDVETAEIINTHNVSGEMNSMNSCLKMASEIADHLSKGSFAEQAEEERLEAIRRAEREEQERKEEKANRIRREGYVDLGLPSGICWKSYDESYGSNGDVYTQGQAIEYFGGNLPSQAQWEELINYCSWSCTGNSTYTITGSNGNSITLNLYGARNLCGFEVRTGDIIGGYWSSTKLDWQYSYALCFNSNKQAVQMSWLFCLGLHVRLVKHFY